MLASLPLDVRFAYRSLGRRPALTAAVVAAIALAIGANTVIFGVVNGVLLRPLPHAEPDRLVRLYQVEPPPSNARAPLSPPNFFDWRERSAHYSATAAFWSPQVTLTGAGEPVRLLGAQATHELFGLLGAAAALGRVYGPEEDRAGAEPVVVLGHGLWERRFGGDPAVLGRAITLDGRPHVVTGVMAPGFDYPRPGTELWLPMRLERQADANEVGMPYRAFRVLEVIARLEDGSTLPQAAAEAETIAARLAREHPDENAGFGAAVVPLLEVEVGEARPGLLALQAAVLLLLLVACANLSSVMLARSAARGRELSVRVALGASRGRLARPLLVESALVTVLGGTLGAALAAGALQALRASSASGLPRLEAVSLDGTVLAFSALATLATGLAFGLGPAVSAAGRDVYAVLRAGAAADQAPRHVRARRLLVVAQIATATVLLVSAGLLARSLDRMLRVDPGFRSDGLLVRGGGGTATLAPAVRAAVRELDPGLPLPPFESLADVTASALARPRLQTALVALFAATALAVACLGLYGLMAYSVACRTREIGVRLALGAGGSALVRRLVQEGMVLALVGLGLGLLGAAAAGRVLRSLLFDTAPLDPLALAAASGLVALVALLACWLPARSAARIDPLVALRAE